MSLEGLPEVEQFVSCILSISLCIAPKINIPVSVVVDCLNEPSVLTLGVRSQQICFGGVVSVALDCFLDCSSSCVLLCSDSLTLSMMFQYFPHTPCLLSWQ